jgi:hypothetical protein
VRGRDERCGGVGSDDECGGRYLLMGIAWTLRGHVLFENLRWEVGIY